MTTTGSRAMGNGFTFMLLSVSTGMHSSAGGFGLLVCFMGVLTGANFVAAGLRMTDAHSPTFPAAFGGARTLAALVRRNTAGVGFVMASCALTVVSGGETDPVLCFAMFALFLLGITLIMNSIGARGE